MRCCHIFLAMRCTCITPWSIRRGEGTVPLLWLVLIVAGAGHLAGCFNESTEYSRGVIGEVSFAG